MKKIFSIKYIRNGLFIIIGLFIGWLLFHSTNTKKIQQAERTGQIKKSAIWTCAMHPQIRMNAAGKCPICGMDLIILNQETTSAVDSNAIQLTPEAIQIANIETSIVSYKKAVKEIRLYGKVQLDERLIQSEVAYFPGRIEKLLINFTGEEVHKGQALALIYSPELVIAQQELLETAKTKQTQVGFYEAAKEKLRRWKLTEAQIAGIESSNNIQSNFEVVSNTTGIVTARRVNNGDYISQGTVLFDIANLSNVWLMFDAYEDDLAFLKKDDKITFNIDAIPGKNFTGNIAFIDPLVDPVNRVSKIRVEIANQSGMLKPEMFATGILNAKLDEFRNKLVIPSSAVLWTGKRSIVYVKLTGSVEPIFKMREIELGPMLGNSYVVADGLNEGEEIVTKGTFSVDASAQLEGKPSMMNLKGGQIATMPGMDSNNKSLPPDKQSGPEMKMPKK